MFYFDNTDATVYFLPFLPESYASGNVKGRQGHSRKVIIQHSITLRR